MNLLIIGHARHGKTESAKILKKRMGFRFQDSSTAAAEIFLYDKLKNEFGYNDFIECYNDRVNHRSRWFDEICQFNKDDPARLAKEIMKKANIYCGMRSNKEIQKCVEDKVFDHIVNIFNPRLPEESSDSFDIDFDSLPKYHTINNDSDLVTLRLKLIRLIMELNIIDIEKKEVGANI